MGSGVEVPVDGTVSRVEHDGLYAQTARGEAVVLIPEVSPSPVHLRSTFAVGDRVRVGR